MDVIGGGDDEQTQVAHGGENLTAQGWRCYHTPGGLCQPVGEEPLPATTQRHFSASLVHCPALVSAPGGGLVTQHKCGRPFDSWTGTLRWASRGLLFFSAYKNSPTAPAPLLYAPWRPAFEIATYRTCLGPADASWTVWLGGFLRRGRRTRSSDPIRSVVRLSDVWRRAAYASPRWPDFHQSPLSTKATRLSSRVRNYCSRWQCCCAALGDRHMTPNGPTRLVLLFASDIIVTR